MKTTSGIVQFWKRPMAKLLHVTLLVGPPQIGPGAWVATSETLPGHLYSPAGGSFWMLTHATKDATQALTTGGVETVSSQMLPDAPEDTPGVLGGHANTVTNNLIIARRFASPMPLIADRIEVGICNFGNITEKDIVRVEGTVAYVFGSVGINIVWVSCAAAENRNGSPNPKFLVRLLDHSRPAVAGRWTPDAFGRAYLSSDAIADYAEVYFASVLRVAVANRLAATDDILGYAMAHELGHLLLGPQHTSRGIMKVRWNVQDLVMMTQHRMKFSQAESFTLHRNIQLSH